MSSKILEGKVGVVVGVANKRSIAFAIAKAWHEAGAKLIFNYQGERLKDGVIKLIHENFGEDAPVYDLDVSSDESINAFFENVRKHTDKVDCMLHSVAFAPKEALGGGSFLETGRDAFKISLDISAYSLVALSRAVEPMMSDNGSILAMSYLGSEKVVPNYNLMGVSKAALKPARCLARDWALAHPRPAASAPVPCRRLRPAAFPVFPPCSRFMRNTPPWAVPARARNWALPAYSWPATAPPPSPAR